MDRSIHMRLRLAVSRVRCAFCGHASSGHVEACAMLQPWLLHAAGGWHALVSTLDSAAAAFRVPGRK